MISRSRWKCIVAFGSPVVPRREPEQRDVVAPGLHGGELHRLVERDAVELGVVVGGAVEADDAAAETAVLGAGDQFVGDRGVSQSARPISALSTIFVSSPARSSGMVLTTTAPALVAASQQATIAGLLAERISTRLPGLTPKSSTSACASRLRPVGQLLVGALSSVADQRGVIAEALARPCGRSVRRAAFRCSG